MGLKTKRILGIDIIVNQKSENLEEIRKYLKTDNRKQIIENKKSVKPLIIFTPNPEIIVYAQKDDIFRKIVNSAQINIPDGWGISWALKKLYGLPTKRISGTDFMLDLVKLSSQEGFTVGLIGGGGGVALKTGECLKRKYVDLKAWAMDGPEIEISNIKDSRRSGIHDAVMRKNLQTASGQKSKIHIKDQKEILKTPGRWPKDSSRGFIPRDSFQMEGLERSDFISLIEKIKKRKTDILFVAFGFPKQEYFIHSLNQQLTINNFQLPIVLMAVGGAFDYISGKVERAPKWVQDRGLEWLYRLIKEPGRLPRQIKGAEFFYRVLVQS